MITQCQETLPGTNYDRFWVEGNQRKLFQTRDKADACSAKLQEIQARSDLDADGKKAEFESYIENLGKTDAEKAAARAREEEKKNRAAATVEDSNWTKEDIQNLTKAIVKFPPGTNQRWKVIAEYCGTRN